MFEKSYIKMSVCVTAVRRIYFYLWDAMVLVIAESSLQEMFVRKGFFLSSGLLRSTRIS
jgi:hypothetical protein